MKRLLPFTRMGGLLDNHWPFLARLGGAVGLAATQFVEGNWVVVTSIFERGITKIGVLLCVSALSYGIGELGHEARSRRVSQLEKDLASATTAKAAAEASLKDAIDSSASDLETTLEWKLRALCERYELTVQDRVTVFYYDDERLFFLGRHSRNGTLKRPGREEFSCREGFIGDAWLYGTAEVRNLPAPGDPLTNKYLDVQKAAGLAEETVAKLTMFSRSYVGWALKDPSGTENIGVVMFESTNAGALTTLDVTHTPEDPEFLSLGVLMMRMKPQADRGTGLVKGGGY